ncbi:hypothetical protein THTE_1941 [Thermogutta terrifontis]|uniref:Uncharacterized protein n=1 Tax=Thermogutta terrifontis TaxID=1331910 RepID=A0A286RF11_9BACT|nr:hypothetical protein THTE_1941 [Thermogutta terrifontis]
MARIRRFVLPATGTEHQAKYWGDREENKRSPKTAGFELDILCAHKAPRVIRLGVVPARRVSRGHFTPGQAPRRTARPHRLVKIFAKKIMDCIVMFTRRFPVWDAFRW